MKLVATESACALRGLGRLEVTMGCLFWFVLVFLLAVPFIEGLLKQEVIEGSSLSREQLKSEAYAVFILLGVIAIWRLLNAWLYGDVYVALVWALWVIFGLILMVPRLRLVFGRDRRGDRFYVMGHATVVLRVWAYAFVVSMVIAACLGDKF